MIKIFLRSIAVFVLTVATNALQAQGIDQRLDSFYPAQWKKGQLNGNVLIAEKDHVLFAKSFGFADLRDSVLNNARTEFTLASISKTFTSTAVLQLMEKHKVGLDDEYVKYFPAFPYASVTIRNLLNHTSGLPDEDDLFDSVINKNPDRVLTNADLMPALVNYHHPLSFKSGDKWEYCNLNYFLLALLVEKISHQSFGDYLKEHIFIPAKMSHTRLDVAGVRGSPEPHRTLNYSFPFYYSPLRLRVDSIAKLRKYVVSYSGMAGASSILSTTEDLWNYDRALSGGKLLSAASLNLAYQPTVLNNGEKVIAGRNPAPSYYGLGWFIMVDSSSGRIVWHSGADPGELNIMLRNLSRGQFVVVLDNMESDGLFFTGNTGMNILDGLPVTNRKKSIADVFAKDIFSKGADLALAHVLELKADTGEYYYSPGEVNYISEELAEGGYDPIALEAFRINVLLYPEKPVALNGYAKELAKTGKKEEAIRIYRRCLVINPDNKAALEGLKKE